MPCRNCQHTLQNVGASEDQHCCVFWCPRCGALFTEGAVPDTEVPALVRHVRAAFATLHSANVPPAWLAVREAAGL
jgi:hypothetical protein